MSGARYQYMWKSVYPESIFDDAGSLLQQFQLETSKHDSNKSGSGVSISSLLTLGDTAASAIIAVTLTAMRKVREYHGFYTLSDPDY